MPMKTNHKITFGTSQKMHSIPSETVDLIVTSPPYPMIKMWDDMFSSMNPAINDALNRGSGVKAFELMHKELDQVWDQAYRVLKQGGFACINIGDSTRTINDDFQLFSNHARILNYLLNIGFTALPDILWRKQSNAPNKFMGSGMLPAGAYVTLEHEYILIVRKGAKRKFENSDEKRNRQQSAIFWEERNNWYSDVWMDIKGTRQELGNSEARRRSAAFPFDLAYRLISMYSAKGDLVLDPFLGTGTTMTAAMTAGRNSVGFEIERTFRDTIFNLQRDIVEYSNDYISNRLKAHILFVAERLAANRPLKYTNAYYGFPVVTSQEQNILLNDLIDIIEVDRDIFEVSYSETPQLMFCKDWTQELKYAAGTISNTLNSASKYKRSSSFQKESTNSQLKLFSK
jgi:DNA modification methylase